MISKRIELLISEKKLSKRAFSRSVNCTDTAINNVISGRNEPGFKIIESILQTYDDISPDWLISGKGNMYRAEEEKTLSKSTLVSSDLLEEAQKQSKELINMLKQSQVQVDNLMKMYSDLVSKQAPGNGAHLDNGVKCAGAK